MKKKSNDRRAPGADDPDRGTVFTRPLESELRLSLAGEWVGGQRPVTEEELRRELETSPAVKLLSFDSERLGAWDSGLLTFLLRVREICAERQVDIAEAGLPEGVERLMALATAVPERRAERGQPEKPFLLERVGDCALGVWRRQMEFTDFIGEAAHSFIRLLTGRARYRRKDLVTIMRDCGFQALPIVSLVSALVGLIFAFISSIQLKMFGAEIYVASLVGIAMVRLMGPIMTGILMAGRTGAAFAAQIGTMQVNEEIDALATLGLSPFEFLVLPRMVALCLMMPLLCLYADLMGILGGLLVGHFILDLNVVEYLNMTRDSIALQDFWIGLFQSGVFGVLVALTGCLKGLQCGRNAAAVGNAATSAVVTGIVSIIVATGIITLVCDVLGI